MPGYAFVTAFVTIELIYLYLEQAMRLPSLTRLCPPFQRVPHSYEEQHQRARDSLAVLSFFGFHDSAAQCPASTQIE
jgi:hypothetical protein